MEPTAKLLGLIMFHRLCQALSHTEYSLGPRMTRSANVRESSSRTAELSVKMEGEREESERERGGGEKGRQRQKENVPRDFFFIAAAPLVARGLRAR